MDLSFSKTSFFFDHHSIEINVTLLGLWMSSVQINVHFYYFIKTINNIVYIQLKIEE